MRPQDSTTRGPVGFYSFTQYEKSQHELDRESADRQRRDLSAHQQAEAFKHRLLALRTMDVDAPQPQTHAPSRAPELAESELTNDDAHDATPRPRRRAPRLDLRSADHARPTESALERHTRKCKICAHPDRDDIESDFLHWHDLSNIVNEFGLGNRRALYRHARATGLYELRMANIRDAAALIAAQAEYCKASGSAVLKAIRACSQIDSLGRWIEPPTRTIRYTVAGEPQPQPSDVAREAAPPSTSATTEISNRHTMQLKTPATPTKHSPAHSSNRPKPSTFTTTWSRFFSPQKSAPNPELTHP